MFLSFTCSFAMVFVVYCFEFVVCLAKIYVIVLRRLENEHLNNEGKYRAFKSVPLPFYYDYNGDKSI
ncbi:hypothetical protein POUND7_020327 [Theobroma cacao]